MIIEAAGFTKTCRPTAHARPVSVWTLADRTAAVNWLDANPELPEPGDDDPLAVQGVLFPLNPRNDTGAAVAPAAPGME